MHSIFLTLVMMAFFFITECTAASFNYLYIEASEGNSSGGHAAIQFGNDVYHFQHLDSGFIRLFRRETEDFHFLYRYLQNRPIHLSRVDVSNETFGVLKQYFKLEFLNQERLFKLLDDLHKDRLFLQFLLNKLTSGNNPKIADAFSVLRLKGVGLFYPERVKESDPSDNKLKKQQWLSIESLHRAIDYRYGPDFLSRRRKEIDSQIKNLTPIDWPDVNGRIGGDNIPPPIYSFSDRYADNLIALFAIDVLTAGRPLRNGVFFQIREASFRLSNAEKPVLYDWRKRLETSLIESINSGRPDWGYAVLVNLARYLAVDESLQTGYWTFIDDFAENSDRIVPSDYLGQTNRLRVLINDARLNLIRLRRSAIKTRFTEAEYSRLEMTANRYFELLKTKRAVAIRYNGEKALPVKSTGFPDNGPFPEQSEKQLKAALSLLKNFENRLLEKLKQNYRYDLITRNCVTEVFRTINRALLTDAGVEDSISKPAETVIAESKKRLGGYVDAAYNFIPFLSEQSVQEQYHVSLTRDLDSYRGMELTKLMARQDKLLTALKESNTLTSHLYKYNSEDALFVFFTDDTLWLRPVLGLFNTAAGIGQSLYGLFSWPFDAGKNLKSGATGILMSLPELVFFNMRKGSYRFLSPQLAANSDL